MNAPSIEQVVEVVLAGTAVLVVAAVLAGLVQLVVYSRAARRAELKALSENRGRDGGMTASFSPDDPGPLVTVADYQELEQAHLARLHLEQHDIPVFIADAGVVGMNWHYAIAVGGVKVQVPQFYTPQAVRLLEQSSATEVFLDDSLRHITNASQPLDASSAGADGHSQEAESDASTQLEQAGAAPVMFEQVTCPNCESSEVYRDRRFRQVVGFLSVLLVGFPLPVGRTTRKCEACGHRWKQRNRYRGESTCPSCGYDLQGTLAAERSECPECGIAIERQIMQG